MRYGRAREMCQQSVSMPMSQIHGNIANRSYACRAAQLALVVWYLVRPPLPHLNAHAIHTDTLPQWIAVSAFPTQTTCEARRGAASPWDRCIASDDPRLKGKMGAFTLTRLR